jgi:hypothetical protein
MAMNNRSGNRDATQSPREKLVSLRPLLARQLLFLTTLISDAVRSSFRNLSHVRAVSQPLHDLEDSQHHVHESHS